MGSSEVCQLQTRHARLFAGLVLIEIAVMPPRKDKGTERSCGLDLNQGQSKRKAASCALIGAETAFRKFDRKLKAWLCCTPLAYRLTADACGNSAASNGWMRFLANSSSKRAMKPLASATRISSPCSGPKRNNSRAGW